MHHSILCGWVKVWLGLHIHHRPAQRECGLATGRGICYNFATIQSEKLRHMMMRAHCSFALRLPTNKRRPSSEWQQKCLAGTHMFHTGEKGDPTQGMLREATLLAAQKQDLLRPDGWSIEYVQGPIRKLVTGRVSHTLQRCPVHVAHALARYVVSTCL